MLAHVNGGDAGPEAPDRELLRELVRAAGLVHRIGVNLNQAVKKLNATGQRPGTDRARGCYAAREHGRRAEHRDDPVTAPQPRSRQLAAVTVPARPRPDGRTRAAPVRAGPAWPPRTSAGRPGGSGPARRTVPGTRTASRTLPAARGAVR